MRVSVSLVFVSLGVSLNLSKRRAKNKRRRIQLENCRFSRPITWRLPIS